MQAFPRNRGKERVRLSLGQRTNHLVSGRPQRGARLPRHAHPVGACRRLVSQERSGGRDRGGLSRPRREGPTIRPAGLSIRCSTRATEKADRKSTRLNSSHLVISYAVFCLKKK